jgi:hypothetical protein
MRIPHWFETSPSGCACTGASLDHREFDLAIFDGSCRESVTRHFFNGQPIREQVLLGLYLGLSAECSVATRSTAQMVGPVPGKPAADRSKWLLVERPIQSALAASAVIALAFDGRFGPWAELGCVLRTASASISRSSVFVFGGCRGIDACQ